MAFETLNNSTFLTSRSDNVTSIHVHFSSSRLEALREHFQPSDLLHFSTESRFLHLMLWCIVFLIGNLAFVYISTWIAFTSQRLSRDVVKVPPMTPYMVPFIGHAISFAFNPARALARTESVHLPGPLRTC